MSLSDLPNELGERGIWWQVIGFAIAGCTSVAILQIWEGSDFWAYRSFEIAVKNLYWFFVLPLAGAIEGLRKMFEKASEIRAAQRAKIWQRGLNRGREQEREEIRKRLLRVADQCPQKDPETGNITLTPEDIDFLLGRGSGADE